MQIMRTLMMTQKNPNKKSKQFKRRREKRMSLNCFVKFLLQQDTEMLTKMYLMPYTTMDLFIMVD